MVTLSVIAMICFVISKFLGYTDHGWTSLAVSLWFIGGIQCMLLGIVGEYVGRTFVETQRRPIYILRETIGDTASRKDIQPRDHRNMAP